ncbi:MAG: hypothetical protein EBU92_10285 [Betaproteobacteria bacterium]|nr:hypothetical protein [Betaproteobacteria bacterium]
MADLRYLDYTDVVCAAIDGDYNLIMRAIHREPWMYYIAVVFLAKKGNIVLNELWLIILNMM